DANVLAEGMKYYSARQYAKAAESLSNQNPASSLKNDRDFYLSLSYLSLGQTQTAIDYLEKLDITANKYDQQVNWYLALAYLKAGKKAEAIIQLREIGEQEYQYAAAGKILDVLE
ncbi:MAG: tetratricopeptide repeat protein, partial [Bacteroidota bacterium]